MKGKEKNKNNLKSRPPVVVFLGHVDHGKTALLDYIRKTNVVKEESGGITQHIGAYQIKFQGKKITFIDTPGHEAFSEMRKRGAKVADIAILVVAADEGVKPQTKEAISCIKKAGIPFIVAINKIDKSQVQPERVKKELLKEGVKVENLGGEIPSQEVSAKTGQGIDDLLEIILLVAEMEKLRADFSKKAKGAVIESYLDSLRGPTTTLLVKEGILKKDNAIRAGSSYGKIKTLEDFLGNSIQEGLPSSPVIVTGFEQVPSIGERFFTEKDLKIAQEKALEEKSKRKKEKEAVFIPPDKKVLNIILKADVLGSLEAIEDSLKVIPQEKIMIRLLKAEAGDINESDLKLAESAKAIIVGFRVKADTQILNLAQRKKIKILIFEVIYELIQKIREELLSVLKPEIIRQDLGKVEVSVIFRTEKNRMIVGGKVLEGKIKKGTKIEVIRDEEKIGQGKLIQLQRDKKDIEELSKGDECGILFGGETRIKEEDILIIYTEEKKRNTI